MAEEPAARRPRKGAEQGFSYVEGTEYDTLADELEAMGGDPSFLMLEEEDDSNEANNGKNDEWDGEVDEEAHLGLD